MFACSLNGNRQWVEANNDLSKTSRNIDVKNYIRMYLKHWETLLEQAFVPERRRDRLIRFRMTQRSYKKVAT